jgi:hypothetical protein
MANIHRMTKKRLGELLLQEGVINDEQLSESLEEQQQTGELIGDILVRKGFCTESDVARTISTQFSFPYISVMHYYIAPEMVSLFPLEQLEKNLFVPIDKFGDVLNVVVAGLLDQDVVNEIEKTTNCSAQVYVGMVSEVKQVIKEKFAKTPVKPAAGQASDVNLDVTAPPAESTATAVAPGIDPALADLEEALKAAASVPDEELEEAGAAITGDLREKPEEIEDASEMEAVSDATDPEDLTPAEADEDDAGREQAAEDEAEEGQEETPKKRRFRFFESD